MDIEQMEVGFMDVFCYLVSCPSTKEALLIDPAGDEDRVVERVKQKNLNLKYIVNTHGHMDHTCGNAKVKELTGGMGCNVVFITAPGKDSHIMAFSLVSVMGTINFYAANYPAIEIPLDPNLLHYKEITLTGSESKTEKDFYKAVMFQNSMNINLSLLISNKFPFIKIKDAMEAALDPSTYRVILEMEDL